MSGTRRMWSRRVLRAGWLIAPLFTAPAKVFAAVSDRLYRMFHDSRGSFTLNKIWGPLAVTVFFLLIAAGLSFMFYDMSKFSDKASIPAMKEAAAEDPCVGKALMEQLSENRVVTRFNLEQMQNKCEDTRATEEQYRALTEQREALHAK